MFTNNEPRSRDRLGHRLQDSGSEVRSHRGTSLFTVSVCLPIVRSMSAGVVSGLWRWMRLYSSWNLTAGHHEFPAPSMLSIRGTIILSCHYIPAHLPAPRYHHYFASSPQSSLMTLFKLSNADSIATLRFCNGPSVC
ncbi:hypothetical protein BAUCODRAFT_461081 [Baudoinia panamericana UAMH 10762]|uniref:Uncharacterized protein n=1 Tax=Baudoinia panamericana (strain UAMH 10762) TaxID=717646 RepID=M2NEI3_BAUPA|nr:uncharacterized protein BAUCODRAFT_461081 [Baudoinia panamericana UAMH 10762]EMC97654.1 hypothetical protein BAUCODRAFT_461081 [Baudoinia panamericana UAMH 10762]